MVAFRTQIYQSVILPLHIHDDRNGLDYTLYGDYYFPDIISSKDDTRPIGKWGRMHKRHLQEHRPALYYQLALQGKRGTYLPDLNGQAQERLEVMTRRMKRTNDIDERLKAQDQQEWIRRMNNIRQRAEEIIMAELINPISSGEDPILYSTVSLSSDSYTKPDPV